ncbi:MAG: MFS transporter, partial [Coriobacteriales bacterium]|nr:MFS transporter [Coriobacteriales bacterium]
MSELEMPLPSASLPAETPEAETGQSRVPLWTPGFVVLIALNFFNFAGMWMLPALLPVYIKSLGAGDWLLGWITGITSVATIISRPLAGLATERFGRRGVLTCGTIGMMVTAAALAVVPLVGVVFAIRFAQGLAWGFANTACATVASDNVPKPRFAEGMGFFGQGSSLAQIIAPAISLTVFYRWGGEVSVLICAGFFALSLLTSCFITYKKIPGRRPAAAPTAGIAGVGAAGEKTAAHSGPEGVALDLPEPIDEKTGAGGGPLEFIRHTLFEPRALLAAAMMFFLASSYGIVQT